MNNLDILEYRILVSNLDMVPNSLLSTIIQDHQFLNFDFGIDILYLIERGISPSITKSSIDLDNLYNYLSEIIDRAINYSSFNYSTEEILIYKKYFYYKLISLSILNIPRENYNIFIKDIENLLTIQINGQSGAWIAKENLRLVLLNFYSSEGFVNGIETSKIKEQLTIARSNDDKRRKLIEISLDKVFYS